MPSHLVGDPVDVVTGASTDGTLDVMLTGPIRFEWWRYYSSAWNERTGSMGRSHRHGYERSLQLDLDGVRYTGPEGESVAFAFSEPDEQLTSAGGLSLWRVSDVIYQVREASGRKLEFALSEPDRPAPLSRIVVGANQLVFRYDEHGRLDAVMVSSDEYVKVRYDAASRIIGLDLREVRVALGGHGPASVRQMVRYTYDDAGYLIHLVDPYNHEMRFGYDRNGRMTSRTDRRGYSFLFEYDSAGRCTRSTGEDGVMDVRLDYRPSERRTTMTRSDGAVWVYGYDDVGIVRQIVDPYGGVRRFNLDDQGRVTEEIDPNGNRTKWLYDDSGGLRGTLDQLGCYRPIGTPGAPNPYLQSYIPRTPIAWEQPGLLAFDSIRLPPLGSPVLATFPSAVGPMLRTAPEQRLSKKHFGRPKAPGEAAFDRFGLLTTFTDPNGAQERWAYDPNGNVVHYIDRDGSSWRNEYRSWNWLVRSLDPIGGVTQYDYTPYEALQQLIDPSGTLSRWGCDLKDRSISLVRHSQVRDVYVYDPGDALVERRALGERMLWRRDVGVAGLPHAITFGDGRARKLEYDTHGRLIRATEGDLVEEVAYDDLGCLRRDQRNGLGVAHEFGKRGFETIRVLDRFAVRYDTLNDETTVVTDPTGRRHRFESFEHGVYRRSLSNGTHEVSQYDWDGRCLAKVAYRSSPSPRLWARRYWYTPGGNLARAEDSITGATSYEYDSAHRLVRQKPPRGVEERFLYDAAWNLLQAPGLSGVEIDENRIVAANGARFAYNDRNHVARRDGSEGAVSYEYDAEDRLTAVHAPSGQWTARYDSRGRRISKTWNGHTTNFYWDRERLAAEIGPDGAVRVYVYVDRNAYVPFMFVDYDSLDAAPDSARRRFVFTNQIGCPVSVEDDSGDVEWSATIEAYGRAHIDPRSRIACRLRWPGHYFDEETGLQYNRRRYYAPELGRYLQSDPADLEGGINLYAYTATPLNEVDLDGQGCPAKPTRRPRGDAEFDEANRSAIGLASHLREILRAEPTNRNRPDGTAITWHDNVTVAVLVVNRRGRYELAVASSVPHGSLPAAARSAVRGSGARPLTAPRRDANTPRYDAPRRGGGERDTGRHAEQRGLRAVDAEGDSEVASITPTRPCCPGCQEAIASRGGSGLDAVNELPPPES